MKTASNKFVFVNKALILLIAVVMMLAMSATAFASDSDPNFTKSPSTEYTYHVVQSSGTQITLQVGPADSAWSFTGFSTPAEAAKVTWTETYGADLMNVGTPTVVDIGGGVYVNQVVLTTQNYWSAYGIRATWNNGAASEPYMDFTVNVDPISMQAAKTGITVDVQAPESGALAAWNNLNTNITATPVGASSSNPLYNTLAIQKYSTPFAALVAMFNSNPTELDYSTWLNTGGFTPDGTYLYSLTGYTGYDELEEEFLTQTRDASGLYGWQYCVYRGQDLHKVAMSQTIGASGFALNSGDTVVWYYGILGYTFPAYYTPMN